MARSAKKGPYIDPKLLARVKNRAGSRETIKTWSRCSMIIPDLIGSVIHVHDGKRFIPVHITEGMVGHKLGEFAPTRTFRMHSGQRKTASTEK